MLIYEIDLGFDLKSNISVGEVEHEQVLCVDHKVNWFISQFICVVYLGLIEDIKKLVLPINLCLDRLIWSRTSDGDLT